MMRRSKRGSRGVSRRSFLGSTLAAGAGSSLLPALAGAREIRADEMQSAGVRPFELDELSIADLQSGMTNGKFTALYMTEKYLERIEHVDKQGPAVNSVIEVNPDALAIAEALDKERKEKEGTVSRHSSFVAFVFFCGNFVALLARACLASATLSAHLCTSAWGYFPSILAGDTGLSKNGNG